MSRPVILVLGAGPGVGGAVARRFARDGHDVGMLGVDEDVLRDLTTELEGLGARVGSRVADLTDHDAATAAVDGLARELGGVGVLHFNPSAFREQDPLELSVPDLLADVTLGVGALLTGLQAARPHMSAGARVTATGSMAADRPWHRAASLGIQKAGLRNLVHSIDATLKDDGIRAVSVTVRGTLAAPGADSPFTPDRVAEAVHAAAHQDEAQWRTEVPYAGPRED